MSSVSYSEELLTDAFIAEITPLLLAHKDELCLYDDFEFDPDWEGYKLLFGLGQLKVITAREDGKLIGYAAYAIHQNCHYRGRKHAIQDVLYIAPEYRGNMMGVRLIKYSDDILKHEGVHLVSHHVKVKNDFGPLLERIGYQLAEKIYERRLN
ncbi:MAG: GNAT family N-acetyltransferase [Candidatus Aenigmarchaeota archaeon]|nr:GNAT family N-acetyltransferase [Candidatus Aenigmarchaeota archaeon]